MARLTKYLLVTLCITLALVLVSCGSTEVKSITSVEKTGTEGNVDTYTIYFSDGDTYEFTITNGIDGTNGKDGANGLDGTNGVNGVDGKDGIDGIDGTDGKDGTDGTNGKDGVDGKDGITPKFKLDGTVLYVSYNNGDTWMSLGDLSAKDDSEDEPVVDESIINITAGDIEQGGYGNGQDKTSTSRIRVKDPIAVTAGTIISYKTNGLRMYVYVVDAPGAEASIAKSGWLTGEGTYTIEQNSYVAILFSAGDGTSNILPSQYTADVTIKLGDGVEPEPLPTHQGRKIYQYVEDATDGGNYWCFVYLPEGYDKDRAEPYPFVIANHGNGWKMDGTAEKANWTNITMYVPTDYAGYNENRHLKTEDSTLWWSNPTIEALLDKGYIVAGAQNYGDTLYGNKNCRDACVAFYEHMTETYNVKDYCYMIGASNGAMTTLNAVSVLGDKVKAIILQYPLTCLVNQYFANSGHQAGIRAAYGITDTELTEEELAAAIVGFDPLTTNVVDGVKQGYFPATKIYYSMDDGTTKADANALPLYDMLTNSDKNVEKVECTGSHGDSSHFNPEEYLAWFEANK